MRVDEEFEGEKYLQLGNSPFSLAIEEGTVWLYRTIIIRGVRYTRNGDGWPDEIDVSDIDRWSVNENPVMILKGVTNHIAKYIGGIAGDLLAGVGVEIAFKEEGVYG